MGFRGAISSCSRPRQFYFEPSNRARRVVQKARPGSLIRLRHQAASHRVAVNIFQFFNAFALREYIEVTVARLPERMLLSLHRQRKFQGLPGLRKHGPLRLADEKTSVFQHDHITLRPVLPPPRENLRIDPQRDSNSVDPGL